MIIQYVTMYITIIEINRIDVWIIHIDTMINIYNTMATQYVFTKCKMALRDWIPIENIKWDWLSANPAAIDLLEANQEKIQWETLESNPAAVKLLKARPDKVRGWFLTANPAADDLTELIELKSKPSDWGFLGNNRGSIKLIESNVDKVDWDMLSKNPIAINILKANQEKD